MNHILEQAIRYIPIVLLFGSVTAGFVCFTLSSPRIHVLPNLFGAFLVFGACLESSAYLFATWALSRGITEAIPLDASSNIANLKHGGAAVDLVVASLAWYGLCFTIARLHARRQRG